MKYSDSWRSNILGARRRAALGGATAIGLAVAVAIVSAPLPAMAAEGPTSDNPVQRWLEIATPYILKIVGAILLLIVARVVAGWTGRVIRRALERRKFDVTLTRFFSGLGRTALLLGAVLGILGMFGVETTSFAAVVGAAGLAIGLALQGTLGNFASGVLLLTFRPFKINDVVKAAGETGQVEEIGLFTTTLITPDHRKIIVPNSGITGGTITNLTGLGTRRVDIEVGTAYHAELGAVRKVLETIPGHVEGHLDEPASQIFLAGLGASSVNWQVRVWCNADDYWTVYQRVIVETKRALDAAGIPIPFPQMDVHMEASGAAPKEAA